MIDLILAALCGGFVGSFVTIVVIACCVMGDDDS